MKGWEKEKERKKEKEREKGREKKGERKSVLFSFFYRRALHQTRFLLFNDLNEGREREREIN